MSLTVKNTRVPPLNPIRFVPLGDDSGIGYNTFAFDRGFYLDTIRNDKVKVPYYQKFQNTDLIAIYIDDLADSIRIEILDSYGNLVPGVTAATPSWVETLSGNTFSYLGADYQYHTYHYTFKPSQSGYALADGVYYIRIKSVYSDSDTYLISEPILISSSPLINTRLLEYSHDVNEFDVLFEQVAPKFAIRVECDITEPKPYSYATAFTDMLYTHRMLNDYPYRVFDFIIGGGAGIPAYELDKVARAMCCKTFAVDNTGYVKDTGASFQVTEFPQSPLKSALIKVQERSNSTGWSFTTPNGTPITLATLPIDPDTTLPRFPCAISTLGMRQGSTIEQTPSVALYDLTDLVNYVTWLNSTYAPSIGALGTYFISGVNVIVYVNDNTENWVPHNTDTLIFTDYLALSVSKAAGGTNSFGYTMDPSTLSGTGSVNICDFGDGTVQTFTAVGGPLSSGISVDRTYAGSSFTGVVYIFHSGTDTNPTYASLQWTFTGTGFFGHNVVANAIVSGSTLPTSMQAFSMQYQAFTGAFDGSIFNACASNIQGILLSSNGITTANNLFAGATFNSNLLSVAISGNAMATAAQNTIITNFYTHATLDVSLPGVWAGGTMTTGQHPSGAADGQLDDLHLTYGWRIYR